MDGQPKKDAIFCAVNKYYLCFAPIFFGSIKKHYPNHPDIIVCLVDCSIADIGDIQLPERSRVFELKGDFSASWPGTERSPLSKFPSALYARYYIFSGMLDSYENVLYLDIDTLSLAPLDELFINHRKIAAALDWTQKPMMIFKDPCDEVVLAMLESDHLRMPKVFFNDGILFVPKNLQKIEIYNRLTALTNRYAAHISYADQSMINLWVENEGGGFHEIPVYYNFQTRFLSFKIYPFEELGKIKIIHFSAMWKSNGMRLFLMKIFFLLSQYKSLLILGLSFYNVYFYLKYRLKKNLKIARNYLLKKNEPVE